MGKLTHTVKGPVASFRSADKANIESLKLHFLPKQEGSGDPSPTNIRPITGWTGMEVSISRKNIIDLANAVWSGDDNKVDKIISGDSVTIVAKTSGRVGFVGSQYSIIQEIPCAWRGKNVRFGCTNVIHNNSEHNCTVVVEFRTEDNAFITDPTVISTLGEFLSRNFTIPSNAAKIQIMFRIAQNCGSVDVNIGDYVTYENFYIKYPEEVGYSEYEGQHIPITFPVIGKNKFNPNTEWNIGRTYRYAPFYFGENEYVVSFVLKDNTINLKDVSFGFSYLEPITAADASSAYTWCFAKGVIQSQKCTNRIKDGNDTSYINCIGRYLFVYPNTDDAYNRLMAAYDIQIEIGNTATAYEAYNSDNMVYGGYVDPIAGEIVAEYKKHIYDGMTMKIGMNFKVSDKFYGMKGVSDCQYGNSGHVISNMLKTQSNHAGNICYQRPSDPGYLMDFERSTICDLSLEEYDALTISEQTDLVNSYLAELYENGTPLIIIYKLINPIHIPIPAEKMKTFLDYNNFWSDTNDDTEVEYEFADHLLYEKRRIINARNDGELIFWLSGEDAPVDGYWVDRIGGLSFKLENGAAHEQANGWYNFDTDGCAYRAINDNPINMGHHFRIEYDIQYRRAKSGIFFDIGSLTSADKAIGFGMASATSNNISCNWKMLGNSSNPWTGGSEQRIHPNTPAIDSDYHDCKGFFEIINGGDGYDRFRCKLNGKIIKYLTQIPQVEYKGQWESQQSYFSIGSGVYNVNKTYTQIDINYRCYVKIRSIKIYKYD